MGIPSQDYFVDREAELALFDAMLRGESDKRVLLLFDAAEKGKTTLLYKIEAHCRAYDPDLPVLSLDFDQDRSGMTPDPAGVGRVLHRRLGEGHAPALSACLGIQQAPGAAAAGSRRSALRQALTQKLTVDEFRVVCFELECPYDDLSGDSPMAKSVALVEFLERHERLPELEVCLARYAHISLPVHETQLPAAPPSDEALGQALLADLAALDARAVLLVDTFERAGQATCTWLEQWLLNALPDELPHVLVVIAGRPECEGLFAATPRWGTLVEPLYELPQLEDVFILEHYRKRGLPVAEHEVSLLAIARRSPGRMAQLGDWLARERGGRP